MAPSPHVLAGLLAIAGLPLASAFQSIRIASTVDAGKETEVTIRNDISSKGNRSFDAGFTHYNVYLALTPPGWGSGPACLLANATPIATTSVKVTIPASVVPDGTDCMISTMEWNEDPTKDGPSGFQYSSEFTVKGGNGVWSKAELDGRVVGNSDWVPCDAFSCVRDCEMKYYPANKGNDMGPMIDTLKCSKACPGVVLPDRVLAELGDGGNSGGPTASGTGTGAPTGTTTGPPSTPTGNSGPGPGQGAPPPNGGGRFGVAAPVLAISVASVLTAVLFG